MTTFVPISALDQNMCLSPEFYVESGTATTLLGADSGIVPLLPPLNQAEVVANGALLALLDAGLANRPGGASYVIVQVPDARLSQNANSSGPNLKYILWNGRCLETRELQLKTIHVRALQSLIDEEGIISKSAAASGITGATPTFASILSAVEDIPPALWRFLSEASSEWTGYQPVAGAALSSLFDNAVEAWLQEPLALDGVALKPATSSEELRQTLLLEFKSTERILESASGGQSAPQAWQGHAPSVGLIKLSAEFFGSDFYVAFTAPYVSRDVLVQVMESLRLRLEEQQAFLERCWQIIGTEISSRVRHMFKNRLGSAYDEILSIRKTGTEKGWISALTQPPEVIQVQREVHGDSEDYFQIGAHLERIEKNLKAVERAVEQLSKFYKGIRGTPELVSVNAVLEQQLTNWRAVRPDVEISKELDPVSPTCLIVPETLSEIFDNIFGNSQKFIPRKPGHHIFVTTSLVRDKIMVDIANDGPSDLPDSPTKLFVTTDPQGSGVGLHLVERLVTEAGGHFSIGPRQKGPGITNQIELPNPRWAKT